MDIILKSLAAAVITAIILLITKFSGPKMAGAIGGIPIIFAVSYILITSENKNLSRDFLIGGIIGGAAAIFFSLILITFNKNFINSHWINFVIAYILCFLFAFSLVNFTSK